MRVRLATSLSCLFIVAAEAEVPRLGRLAAVAAVHRVVVAVFVSVGLDARWPPLPLPSAVAVVVAEWKGGQWLG